MLSLPINFIDEILVRFPRSISINKSRLFSSNSLSLVSIFGELYPKDEYNLLIISMSLDKLDFMNDLLSLVIIIFLFDLNIFYFFHLQQ